MKIRAHKSAFGFNKAKKARYRPSINGLFENREHNFFDKQLFHGFFPKKNP
jgi:hypothetical protein